MQKVLKKKLEFEGALGVPLAAILEAPERPRAYAVFAHCFTCTKDFLAPARVARALAERGIAVLRFDFTGLGNSCGEFVETGFSTNVADIEAAALFLREHYEAPSLLLGHSLGGAASLVAAANIASVRAVATIAAPSGPGGLRRLVDPVIDDIQERGWAEIKVAGRPFQIGRTFLEDMERYTPDSIVGDRLRGKAILVLHSPSDETVDILAAQELFTRVPHPKSFVSLDDADHLLRRPSDAHYVANVVEAWSSRYLGLIED